MNTARARWRMLRPCSPLAERRFIAAAVPQSYLTAQNEITGSGESRFRQLLTRRERRSPRNRRHIQWANDDDLIREVKRSKENYVALNFLPSASPPRSPSWKGAFFGRTKGHCSREKWTRRWLVVVDTKRGYNALLAFWVSDPVHYPKSRAQIQSMEIRALRASP